MTGRSRGPGGAPRKASQRKTRPAVAHATKAAPLWRLGDRVHWKGRIGSFRRDVGDGEHSEVLIDGRVYRVRTGELS